VPVLTFPLDEPVSASIAAELVKESVYIAPGIRDFALRDDNRLAEVTIDEAASPAAIEDKVRRYLGVMLARFRTIEPSIYAQYRRPGGGAYHADVFGELQRREWLFPVGAGAVSLAGPALALHRALDRLFARAYATEFATVARLRLLRLAPEHEHLRHPPGRGSRRHRSVPRSERGDGSLRAAARGELRAAR
jgi:hypothetical protein